MATPEKLKNFLQKLEELPYRRSAQLMRSKLDDLLHEVDTPYLDQYRGRRIPAMISKLYQFGPTSPRRTGQGFDALAPVVVPGSYTLPRNNNILIGRDRSFYWCRTAVHGFISATFTSTPSGVPIPDPGIIVNSKPAGDIFSSVISENGGALILDNQFKDAQLPILGAVNPISSPMANWSAELHMYDKTRGRFYSDAPVPMQFFSNGQISNKALAYNMRLDAGSEIEPRFYLKEFRPYRLDTNALFTPASVNGYLNIVFIGYQELEDGEDEGMFDTLKDPENQGSFDRFGDE